MDLQQYFLKKDAPFPPISVVGDDDIIALGGELTPERLIEAYHKGIFPYYDFRTEFPVWVCPLDRFVIFPKEIHVSHSMRTLINSGKYHVTFNESFDEVIRCCAAVDGRIFEDGAWLGPNIVTTYTALHRMGLVQSVEVRKDDGTIVGGLYGVTLGHCFFGESMFSFEPSASKLALIALSRKMVADGWHMIDCQYETPHLLTMGGRHIPYQEYMTYITN